MTVIEFLPPLGDWGYQPKHPPVDGKIPDVVARFGKATQLRWFHRFLHELKYGQNLEAYWVTSEHHRGPCCDSCEQEYLEGHQGGGPMMDGWCCCKDSRQPWSAS